MTAGDVISIRARYGVHVYFIGTKRDLVRFDEDCILCLFHIWGATLAYII